MSHEQPASVFGSAADTTYRERELEGDKANAQGLSGSRTLYAWQCKEHKQRAHATQ